jgi:hypothetical protein
VKNKENADWRDLAFGALHQFGRIQQIQKSRRLPWSRGLPKIGNQSTSFRCKPTIIFLLYCAADVDRLGLQPDFCNITKGRHHLVTTEVGTPPLFF